MGSVRFETLYTTYEQQNTQMHTIPVCFNDKYYLQMFLTKKTI